LPCDLPGLWADLVSLSSHSMSHTTRVICSVGCRWLVKSKLLIEKLSLGCDHACLVTRNYPRRSLRPERLLRPPSSPIGSRGEPTNELKACNCKTFHQALLVACEPMQARLMVSARPPVRLPQRCGQVRNGCVSARPAAL